MPQRRLGALACALQEHGSPRPAGALREVSWKLPGVVARGGVCAESQQRPADGHAPEPRGVVQRSVAPGVAPVQRVPAPGSCAAALQPPDLAVPCGGVGPERPGTAPRACLLPLLAPPHPRASALTAVPQWPDAGPGVGGTRPGIVQSPAGPHAPGARLKGGVGRDPLLRARPSRASAPAVHGRGGLRLLDEHHGKRQGCGGQQRDRRGRVDDGPGEPDHGHPPRLRHSIDGGPAMPGGLRPRACPRGPLAVGAP
mmetsp:Transcript_64781/g.200534  ORF Transcript_64781/g.200534 Transcript_64781/m.200534 type:complete len:255 (-) Transcript_64781:391-1155(-)